MLKLLFFFDSVILKQCLTIQATQQTNKTYRHKDKNGKSLKTSNKCIYTRVGKTITGGAII